MYRVPSTPRRLPCGPFCSGCEFCCDIIFVGEGPNGGGFGDPQMQVSGDNGTCAKSIVRAIEDVQKRTDDLQQKLAEMEQSRSEVTARRSTLIGRRKEPGDEEGRKSATVTAFDYSETDPNRYSRRHSRISGRSILGTDSRISRPLPPTSESPEPTISDDNYFIAEASANAMRLCLVMMEEIKLTRAELSKCNNPVIQSNSQTLALSARESSPGTFVNENEEEKYEDEEIAVEEEKQDKEDENHGRSARKDGDLPPSEQSKEPVLNNNDSGHTETKKKKKRKCNNCQRKREHSAQGDGQSPIPPERSKQPVSNNKDPSRAEVKKKKKKKCCHRKRDHSAHKDRQSRTPSERSNHRVSNSNDSSRAENNIDAMKLCLVMMDEIRTARAELAAVMTKCMAANATATQSSSPPNFDQNTIPDKEDPCLCSNCHPEACRIFPTKPSSGRSSFMSDKLCDVCSNRSMQPQNCSKARKKCKYRCKCGKPCRICCHCEQPNGECVCSSQKEDKVGCNLDRVNKNASPTRCKSCKSFKQCCFTAAPGRCIPIQANYARNHSCPRQQLFIPPPRRCPKGCLTKRTWCCWPCASA